MSEQPEPAPAIPMQADIFGGLHPHTPAPAPPKKREKEQAAQLALALPMGETYRTMSGDQPTFDLHEAANG